MTISERSTFLSPAQASTSGKNSLVPRLLLEITWIGASNIDFSVLVAGSSSPIVRAPESPGIELEDLKAAGIFVDCEDDSDFEDLVSLRSLEQLVTLAADTAISLATTTDQVERINSAPSVEPTDNEEARRTFEEMEDAHVNKRQRCH